MHHKLVVTETYNTLYHHKRHKAHCEVCGSEFDYNPRQMLRMQRQPCPPTEKRSDIFMRASPEYKNLVRYQAARFFYPSMTAFIIAAINDFMKSLNGGRYPVLAESEKPTEVGMFDGGTDVTRKGKISAKDEFGHVETI